MLGCFLWPLASLVTTGVPALVAVGLITQTLTVALVQLVLPFPSGRLPDHWSCATASAARAS